MILEQISRSYRSDRRGAASRACGLLIVTLAIAACGPAVPGQPRDTSPLSSRAEPAPLPTIGSAFVDQPLSAEEQGAGGHSMHGGHGMPSAGAGHSEHGGAAPAAAADHAAHGGADAGVPPQDEPPGEDHSGHPSPTESAAPSPSPEARDAGPATSPGHGGHGGHHHAQ